MRSHKHITDYAASPKGVALWALREWEFHKKAHEMDPHGEDAEFHSGYCRACSSVLRLLTGRNVGTEREIVEAVIDGI